MRRTIVHVHLYDDVEIDDAERRAILQTVPAYFALAAGDFEVEVKLQATRVPFRVSSRALTGDQLHEDLGRLPRPDPTPAWFARVLVAKSAVGDSGLSTYGVMFDFEPGQTPREGCAVFLDAVRRFPEPVANPGLMLARTIAHELGHVFNLCHASMADRPQEIMVGDPIFQNLTGVEFSAESVDHLVRHETASVRPASGAAYGEGGCRSNHAAQEDCSVLSAARRGGRRAVRLELEVHPGAVYAQTAEPTLVIGEPLHVTASIVNDSRRGVYHPEEVSTGAQSLILGRCDGKRFRTLRPPLGYCRAMGRRGWVRVAPGERAFFNETLLFRRGELVFPAEGRYQLTAALYVRNRWLRSAPVVVRLAPPLKPRHERSCETAADPRVGLAIELGGALHIPGSLDLIRELLRSNPDFPLNDLAKLTLGRRAAQRGPGSSRRWIQWLEGLGSNGRFPAFLRAEARQWGMLDALEAGNARAGVSLRQSHSRLAPHNRVRAGEERILLQREQELRP